MTRKVAGLSILGIALGMFLMMIIREVFVGIIIMAVLSAAGYFCVSD